MCVRRLSIPLAILLAFSVAAPATGITNGTKDANNQYPYVVLVATSDAEGNVTSCAPLPTGIE